MLSVLLSWIIIFVASLIFGYGAVKLLYGRCHESLQKLDVYLVVGLMFLNVYAEIFSLFYKVGGLACLILFVLGIMTLLSLRLWGGEKYNNYNNGKLTSLIKGREWNIILICVGVAATLFWTVGYPTHYDTSVYHVQAIKWIEEYGVVPGLGNLHNRFAYNSAFMPLQALFSLEWILGQSLHTVNGYICALAIAYAIGTNGLVNGKKLKLSDFLKIIALIYVYEYRSYISSPSSDTLTMLLVLYICIKWSEFVERDIKEAIPYTCLCVLAVWAVTVKLSAAVCIVLAIYPAVLLIKNKQWGKMICNISLGLIVIVPWLARNVIISGYLLYPYPQIDLFNVDWKMPASVCVYDAREIMAWGRGLNNYLLYELSIWEWFPRWFETVPKTITILGLISGNVIVIWLCCNIIRRRKTDIRYTLLFVYSIIALVVWLFSAPLFRYGMVYLLIPICEVIWMILGWTKNNVRLQYSMRILVILLLIPIWSIYISSWGGLKNYPTFMQENYEWKLTDSVEIADGISVWYPVADDRGSYDVFPCVPFINMIKKIEVRGAELADGFRMKEEYRNLRLKTDGNEW